MQRERKLFASISTGGLTGPTRSVVRHYAKRATGQATGDRTRYGPHRGSTRSFYTHHVQQMSKAAVIYDAMAICKQIKKLKMRVCGAAVVAPAPFAAGHGA